MDLLTWHEQEDDGVEYGTNFHQSDIQWRIGGQMIEDWTNDHTLFLFQWPK